MTATEARRRHQSGIGEEFDGPALLLVEQNRGARLVVDEIAHHTVVARVGELGDTGVAVDCEYALGVGIGTRHRLAGGGDELEMGVAGHAHDHTEGV
jgi:hypothetical protein